LLLIVSASRHDLSEDDFVEFSKNVQDSVIGTKDGVAHVCHRFCSLLSATSWWTL